MDNRQIKKPSFDPEAFKCTSFLEGLNRCNSFEEIKQYIDRIVDGFPVDSNSPKQIGTCNGFFAKEAYVNGGEYSGFIHPSIRITNSNVGFSYHIYDREYLYAFAYGLRRLNLPNDTNLLPYVLMFLDSYFGFPKDKVDRRDDVLYDFAVKHAEEFYKEHNISIDPNMGAVDQMQMSGDFPLSALKGTYSAQCVERSALAQNLMRVCGYQTSIMYGDCESRGQVEGHCWNAIYDKNGNMYILDFSNMVYSYRNGVFHRREPFAGFVSGAQLLVQDGVIELADYHYEDGKIRRDAKNRKYAIGKTMKDVVSKQDEVSSNK